MLTIAPPPRSIMPGIACLQHRNVPRALTAKTFSHTSSGVSGALVVEPIAGDVGQHVEAAHRRGDRVLVADVERQRPARRAPSSPASACTRSPRRVGEHDLGALGVQGARDRLADPRAGAGDERAAPLEAIVGHQVRYGTVSRAPDSRRAHDRVAHLGGAVAVLERGAVRGDVAVVADRGQQVVELVHEGVLPADDVARRPPVLPERVVGLGDEHGPEALDRGAGRRAARGGPAAR